MPRTAAARRPPGGGERGVAGNAVIPMHDETAFLQAMQENPEDATLRLIFADWLEERGDPRSELIRLLHTLTQSVEVPDRSNLEDRLRNLLATGVQPVGPFWTNSIGMKFAWIPPGTFLMGTLATEDGRSENETQHKVTLSKGFYLAIHPVTGAYWQEIMGVNPSENKHDEHPVEQVSWEDCQEFLRRLSDREQHACRLPTEAEWEWACRASTTTSYYFGKTISKKQANFGRWVTSIMGFFRPNAWGLYDMHGNVWEWCADWFGDYPQADTFDPQGALWGTDRVLRGGSFYDQASKLRSASRHGDDPTLRYFRYGFRVARTFP